MYSTYIPVSGAAPRYLYHTITITFKVDLFVKNTLFTTYIPRVSGQRESANEGPVRDFASAEDGKKMT
jgi:hypothetical protein